MSVAVRYRKYKRNRAGFGRYYRELQVQKPLLNSNLLPSDPKLSLLSRVQRPKAVSRHIDFQIFLCIQKFDVERGIYNGKSQQHL